jgi:sulfide:quinone oxidoreductase
MAGSDAARVVVAGGGVAGLEALMALRALAGARVELTLVAPHDDFVYRPLAVDAPYAVARARQASLDDAAAMPERPSSAGRSRRSMPARGS